MKFIIAIILFPIFFVPNTARRVISMNGNWNGSIQDRPTENFVATVPGGAYTDLLRHKSIPGNLVGDNDVKNRWVAKSVITFLKRLEVDEELLSYRNLTLTLHGVDTFSTITLDGYPIFDTTNMFVRYQHNMREYLELGTYELGIVLFSPITMAKAYYDDQSENYTVPPECVPEIYNGECHVNHIRKMQASFAWDWGPAFPSIGIWKDVELQAFNDVLLTDVTAHTFYRRNNNTWDIVIRSFLGTASMEGNEATVSGEISVSMLIEESIVIRNNSQVVFPLNGQTADAAITLTVNDNQIARWWPNGYGNQTLYSLNLKIIVNGETMSRKISIGFRTVELVQEPLAKGESFYFKINDIPIFAKGSNWIPSSIFPELSSDLATIDHLLKSSKDANMNMLRVWGGGLYESDSFYELADEYGIMIWQDFMFACAMYPTSEDFLDTVREEVKQNVMRLQRHPSIVIWSGNNENEAALYGNWYGTNNNESLYKDDYIKLYVDTIKNEFQKWDPITPFVVSSPSDGEYTEKHNYIGPNPYSNLYGDVHYYNYILNGWDVNQYPRTRFASEYGVQSLPSIETLQNAVKGEEDLRISSEFMKHRQHLLGGYEAMEHLVSQNLRISDNIDNTTNDLTNYIYLTQINQAVSIKIETEYYRQSRSELNGLGEGMTMGALYWQLNDVWQTPSWSSIEFGGRWKMLHYYAVEFFAPVIITPHVSYANELEVYIVSDELTPINNCSFAINTYKWNSSTPIHTKNYQDVTIPSNGAKMVASFWLDHHLHDAGCGSLATMKKNCVLEIVLRDKTGNRIAPFNYVYPAPLKSVTLPSVSFSVRVNPIANERTNSIHPNYDIEIRATGIALFVWLNFDSDSLIDGRFSENGFHMFSGTKNAVFYPQGETTVEKIVQYLRVTTLRDTYEED